MDWLTLLVGIALGIIANLLTPSVQRALATTMRWSGSKVSRLSEKGMRTRLRQLEEDHVYIIKLRNSPPDLIALVTSSVMGLVFVTFIVMVMVFFLTVSGVGPSGSSSPWNGVIGGILGMGTRWFFGALYAWGVVDKVRDFEGFEKKNLASRQEIQKLLSPVQHEG